MEHSRPDVRPAPRHAGLPQPQDAGGMRDGWMDGWRASCAGEFCMESGYISRVLTHRAEAKQR